MAKQSLISQPRAIGHGLIVAGADSGGITRIKDLRNAGSTKLVFPKRADRHLEAILVNTAGGITGGDRFELDVKLERGGALTLTTQAAERAYRAQFGEVGHITTQLDIAEGATLKWLPQEMILFDQSALRRRLRVSLAAKARFLMVEPLVFGRAAMGETLRNVMFSDRIQITRDGMPVFQDGIELWGDATQHLSRAAIADGAGAMANVVMVAPGINAHLEPVRAALPSTAGASILDEGILAVRLLAQDSFEMRRSLIPVLEYLSQTALPRSWSL
jgi:urease accessory protein